MDIFDGRRSSWTQDLKNGGSRAYLKCRKAYAIMPVGKKDESAHCGTQKAPEVATPGLFYSVVARWLIP